jgi:hypothetical protein
MLTVIESPLFSRLRPDYWTDEEYGDFGFWLGLNPDAGDLIPGSGGCRKIRWSRPGMGKRGGVRVIYLARLKSGELVLLTMYAKNARDTIAADVLRKIARELSDD